MKKFLQLISILIFLELFILTSLVQAQASVSISLSDPIYLELDQLEAFGLMPSKINGQKPYTRLEVARLIKEALHHYNDFEASYRNQNSSFKKAQRRFSQKVSVDLLLKRLEREYQSEIALLQSSENSSDAAFYDLHPLDNFQFIYFYLDEQPLSLIPDNGLGEINADLQPLVLNPEGRHYQPGSNFGFETLHWGRVGYFFSFQFQPRFQGQITNAPFEDETKFFAQRANIHFAYKKLDVEFGRDLLNWGLSSSGGLTFSTNPRAFDMFKISNSSPLRLPGPFKKLGYHQWSLVIANLGPEQYFENAWLWAFKWSYKPVRQFELGWTHMMIAGGKGAPKLSLGDAIQEWFSFEGQGPRSNQNFSLELSGEIPYTRGSKIYTELYFEDFSSNFKTMFEYNTSYLVGLHLPRLTHTGRASARLEYRHLSPRYARHSTFTDGTTLNRYLFGDFNGPDSDVVALQWNYLFSPKTNLDFQFQFSNRRNQEYQIDGNEIIKVNNAASKNEYRYLYSGGLIRSMTKKIYAALHFGIEHVDNFNFSNEDETFWSAQLNFVYQLY